MSKVELRNVSKVFYVERQEPVVALQNVSFGISAGEFVTIIGPSGCGKSTILNLIAHVIEPTEGTVLTDGEPMTRIRSDRISMVFQEAALFPWRTVIQNAEFGLELRGLAKPERRRIVERYVRMVGLNGFENRYPNELSGGMQQRVSIARALALETDILLMDEPFGALDEQTRLILADELVRIWEETGKTIIFVTHSLIEAAYLSDRIFVMTARPGRLTEVVEVNVPRRRDIESEELAKIRASMWKTLSSESLRAMMQG